MLYIFENPNNLASVVYDETILTEKEKAKGIAIEQLPEEQTIEGKIAVLKCRKTTGEVWYEYEDIPVTKDDKISELEKQVNALNIAMAEIMGV